MVQMKIEPVVGGICSRGERTQRMQVREAASGRPSRMTVNCERHFPIQGVNRRLSVGSRRLHSCAPMRKQSVGPRDTTLTDIRRSEVLHSMMLWISRESAGGETIERGLTCSRATTTAPEQTPPCRQHHLRILPPPSNNDNSTKLDPRAWRPRSAGGRRRPRSLAGLRARRSGLSRLMRPFGRAARLVHEYRASLAEGAGDFNPTTPASRATSRQSLHDGLRRNARSAATT